MGKGRRLTVKSMEIDDLDTTDLEPFLVSFTDLAQAIQPGSLFAEEGSRRRHCVCTSVPFVPRHLH